MTHRERFLAAVHHQVPDRVPLDLMGTAGGLVDEALFALRDYLGLEDHPRRFRTGENVNYYDEQILDALDMDTRRVWLRQPPHAKRYHGDGSVTDEWGLRRIPVGGYMQMADPPLAEATAADLARYPWPDAHHPARVEGLAEEAARLCQETDYAVVARAPCAGFLDIACWLRGTERFMQDLILDPEFARRLVGCILDTELALFEAFLKAVGPNVQMVETMDDMAANNGPLVSPAHLREFILPAHRELNALIKSLAPEAAIFLHSDGDLMAIMGDLSECGVDVTSPTQPNLEGMPFERLKAEFGDRICFHGGVDSQGALRGTLDDVEADVRRCVRDLGRDGGYIVAPCNHLQADVPPANVVQLYQAAREQAYE
mgnify:FL=1